MNTQKIDHIPVFVRKSAIKQVHSTSRRKYCLNTTQYKGLFKIFLSKNGQIIITQIAIVVQG